MVQNLVVSTTGGLKLIAVLTIDIDYTNWCLVSAKLYLLISLYVLN